MYLTEFLTIAVAHLLAVASPGPDFAIVLRQSIVRGKHAGLWTSLGIAGGILLHVTYCLLGIGLLLSSSANLLAGVKLVAAVYLVYLGITAIKASLGQFSYHSTKGDGSHISAKSLVLTGFLTNGLNPKATLFFLALFSVIIDADTPLLVQVGYGVYLSLATFIWFASLSLLLGIDSVRRFMLRAGQWFERAMGIILIALGMQLFVTLAPS